MLLLLSRTRNIPGEASFGQEYGLSAVAGKVTSKLCNRRCAVERDGRVGCHEKPYTKI